MLNLCQTSGRPEAKNRDIESARAVSEVFTRAPVRNAPQNGEHALRRPSQTPRIPAHKATPSRPGDGVCVNQRGVKFPLQISWLPERDAPRKRLGSEVDHWAARAVNQLAVPDLPGVLSRGQQVTPPADPRLAHGRSHERLAANRPRCAGALRVGVCNLPHYSAPLFQSVERDGMSGCTLRTVQTVVLGARRGACSSGLWHALLRGSQRQKSTSSSSGAWPSTSQRRCS
jgi:hypothetical protein